MPNVMGATAMQIVCPKCDATIPADNLDLGRNLAKCGVCGEVFNCAAQLDGLASPGGGDIKRGEVPLPKGLRVYRRADGLRILRRWLGPKFFGLAFFCLFWNGFMVVWFTIAITQKQWAMAAFGTVHGLVGLGVAYFTLAGFLNTTTITVVHGLLSVTSGPIRVPGNKNITADALQQLYTKRHVSHGKNGTSISYELRAQTTDGKDEKLVGGLDKQEQALFMEQQIEEFLGIEDRPIRGEVER
jgi:hypothetical protein